MPLLDELLLPPDEDQIKAIKAELGEDTERFENCMKHLEEWMHSEPHLPKNYERNVLAVYLRYCKYDLEKTKKKVEMFFVVKTTMPEMRLRDYTEKELRLKKCGIAIPLPKLTPEGYRIILARIVCEPEKDLWDWNLGIQFAAKFGFFRLCKEHMNAGVIYIGDATHMKKAYLSTINWGLIMKGVFLLNNLNCYRIKCAYGVNIPSYLLPFEKFKYLVKPKLRDRYFLDAGISSIYKNIPKDCLPCDYGGTLPSTQELMDKWHQCEEEHKDWFEYWDKVKLIGPVPKKYESFINNDSLGIGMQGTFRQLNID